MLISVLYALLAAAIIAYELTRKKRMLVDQFSVVTLFFLVYLVVPVAILHFLIDVASVPPDRMAGYAVVRYLHHIDDPLENLILFFGSLIAYGGLALGYRLVAPRLDGSGQEGVDVNHKVRFGWVSICLVFSFMMLVFGNSLAPGDPIGGLLLSTYFRADDPFFAFERTPLNANIYTATTTFLLFLSLVSPCQTGNEEINSFI